MFKKVGDLFVRPQQSITEALAVLNRSGIGLALVVNEDSELLGTVTDGDVRRALLRDVRLEEPVERIMNPHPVTAPLGTPRDDLLAMMRVRRKRQIPLLADGQVVDIAWQDQFLEMDQTTSPTAPVVIMCGGLGTRLRPLTEDTPKPLLHVGGKPVLQHMIEGLAEHRFKQIYLAINYQAEKIERYCADGQQWGVRLDYVRESKLLGTAGALSLLRERLVEPTLVLNGDLLTGIKYAKLLEFHLERNFDLTMGVKPYQIQVPYGVVNLEGDQVRQLEEKPMYSFFTNAGIYVLNPEVIALIPYNEYYDMTDLIDQVLARHGRVGAFPVHEYWLDVGQHADYERANYDIDNGGL